MSRKVVQYFGSLLFVCGLLLVASQIRVSQELSESEKIKLRVEQYYNAVQSNQQAKVAEFLVPKARGTFFPQFDPKLVATRVADVKVEEGGNSAVVKIVSQ